MEMAGKKALVFGGTSGIGLATTERLRRAGADVVAVSRDPSKVGNLEGVALAACDVRDRDALSALFVSHAPFDILVSAATGGDRSIGPFLEMDLDGFVGSFDKLWGYANVVRLGTEHLSTDGTIVLVTGAPARRARPGQVSLAAVGAAIEQFIKSIAVELSPRRINAVSPGIIDTPMNPLQGDARAKAYASATEGNPIERAGTADECAQAVQFLIENDFVTGTVVDVDGGWLISD